MEPLRHFGFLLKDTARLLSKDFERRAIAEQLGLTLEQCRVLVYLEKNQGISQTRLACLTEIDPMTLVRIVDRIEANGWIERRRDPADRRVWRLHLTRSAQPILKRIWAIADEARDDALAGLKATQIEQALQLLNSIHDNLAALVPNASALERSPSISETPSINEMKASAKLAAHVIKKPVGKLSGKIKR